MTNYEGPVFAPLVGVIGFVLLLGGVGWWIWTKLDGVYLMMGLGAYFFLLALLFDGVHRSGQKRREREP